MGEVNQTALTISHIFTAHRNSSVVDYRHSLSDTDVVDGEDLHPVGAAQNEPLVLKAVIKERVVGPAGFEPATRGL